MLGVASNPLDTPYCPPCPLDLLYIGGFCLQKRVVHFGAMRVDFEVAPWILQPTEAREVDFAARYSIAQSCHCLLQSKNIYNRLFEAFSGCG